MSSLDPGVAIWYALHMHVTCMSHAHQGDIQQLLDDLGVRAVEGQPVHLHAHDARDATPDFVPHQDAQHFFFLEKIMAEIEIVKGEEKRNTNESRRKSV